MIFLFQLVSNGRIQLRRVFGVPGTVTLRCFVRTRDTAQARVLATFRLSSSCVFSDSCHNSGIGDADVASTRKMLQVNAS